VAYYVELDTECKATACKNRAVMEIFNAYNASMGKFCRPCAKRRLKTLNAQEASDKRVTVQDAAKGVKSH
jgi:hypothetical protein